MLLALCFFLTVILQAWVGGVTIYRGKDSERLLLHSAILAGTPPEGRTWEDLGAVGTQLRVFTVFFAESLSKILDFPVLQVYLCLDTLCLFMVLLGFFAYLRYWFSIEYALIGLLFFSVVSILSYHFFYFHPWDRVSQLCWLGLLFLLRSERYFTLAVLLVFTIFVKHDTLPFPLLMFFVTFRRAAWKTSLFRSFVFAVLVYAAYQVLLLCFYEVSASSPLVNTDKLFSVWKINLYHFKQLWIAYPPFLLFGLVGFLAFPQLFSRDRFLRGTLFYGILILGPYLCYSYFREVRAYFYVTFLFLPPALHSLRELLSNSQAHNSVRASEDVR